MNSSGIALIVKLLIQSQRSGRRLAVCGLSDHFVDIFQITRLSDYISIRSKNARGNGRFSRSPAMHCSRDDHGRLRAKSETEGRKTPMSQSVDVRHVRAGKGQLCYRSTWRN